MLLRLSRLSFWLAAALAAFALPAPGERERLLAVTAAAAGVLALTLLRLALRAETPEPTARAVQASTPMPGEAMLLDAAAHFAQAANAAAPAAALTRRIAAARRRAQPGRAHPLVIVGRGGVDPESSVRLLRPAGCRVSVASGMLDGPSALRRTQFDLFLIDTQTCDTPVIAVSGTGLPGAEERFRELGFDDHLSKPFRRRELLAMLSKQLRSPEPSASTDAASAPLPAEGSVLDPVALAHLAELDPTGENRLLERVLQAFQASVLRLRPQLDAARSTDDRAAIRLVAHTLKSSSASIGALRLSQLCAQIETAIRLDAGDAKNELTGSLGEFDAALDGTLQAIATLIGERA